MVKESSPKWLLAVCYEWVMYHKDFGRKPLEISSGHLFEFFGQIIVNHVYADLIGPLAGISELG